MVHTFPTLTDRLAIITATPEVLIDLCKVGAPRLVRIVAYPLPADTAFVRAGHDSTGELLIVISSASFDIVLPGAAIPHLPATTFQVVFPEEGVQ